METHTRWQQQTNKPAKQRHAESPACCRVGVTEGDGVFSKGIVVDDRGLAVMKRLPQKPLLQSTQSTSARQRGEMPLINSVHQGDRRAAGLQGCLHARRGASYLLGRVSVEHPQQSRKCDSGSLLNEDKPGSWLAVRGQEPGGINDTAFVTFCWVKARNGMTFHTEWNQFMFMIILHFEMSAFIFFSQSVKYL